MATGIGSINNTANNNISRVKESKEARGYTSDLDSKYSQDDKFNMSQLGVELGKMLNKTRDAARELSKQQQVNAVGYSIKAFDTNKNAVDKAFNGGMLAGVGGFLGGIGGIGSSICNFNKFRIKGNNQAVKTLTTKDANKITSKLKTLELQPNLKKTAGNAQTKLNDKRVFNRSEIDDISPILNKLKEDNLSSLQNAKINREGLINSKAELKVCNQKIKQQKDSINAKERNDLKTKKQALENEVKKTNSLSDEDKNKLERIESEIKQLKCNDNDIDSLQRTVNKGLNIKAKDRGGSSAKGMMCDGVGRLGPAGGQMGSTWFTKESEQFKNQADFTSAARSNTQQNASESLDSAKKFSQEVSSIMKDMVTLNGNLASALGKI